MYFTDQKFEYIFCEMYRANISTQSNINSEREISLPRVYIVCKK